jgi:parallel beta-helix repeat protein
MSPNGNDAGPGTIDAPVRSVRRAVALAPDGGTIVLRGGEHRTWTSNSAGTMYEGVNKDLTIQGYPGEQAWFNGSDVVADGWVSAGPGRWSRAWETPSFCEGKYYQHPPDNQPTSNEGPCSHFDMAKDPQFPAAGDPQMVFVDGVDQRQVGSVDRVAPGTFHYDWAARRITIGVDPTGRQVELSSRPLAMVLGGNRNYTIRGVGFHRYASNQYENITGSTVYLGANRAVVENVVFSFNAGVGLAWAAPRNGSSVTRSVFAYNGSIGLGANGSSRTGERNDLRIEDNVFTGNNYERFGAGCFASCGAGNLKLTRMVGFTLRNNVIERAFGPEAVGFWCDIDCRDGVMVNNLVRDNGKHGIFYEISSRGIIASNLVLRNGAKGIMVGSASTKVVNNTVVVDTTNKPKAQGIAVYDDPRWPNNPEGTGPNTSAVEVLNNVVVGPAAVLFIAHDGPGPNNTQTASFFTAVDSNAYHHNGQNIVSWINGDPRIGQYFSSLSAFSRSTGWDPRGVEVRSGADPFFVASGAGDFRARAGSPIAGTGQALSPEVATAIGVTGGGAVDRGALRWPQVSW